MNTIPCKLEKCFEKRTSEETHFIWEFPHLFMSMIIYYWWIIKNSG